MDRRCSCLCPLQQQRQLLTQDHLVGQQAFSQLANHGPVGLYHLFSPRAGFIDPGFHPLCRTRFQRRGDGRII